MNKKNGLLALAALGAYAYYKFSKMSPEQKDDLKSSLRETGRKIVDNLPADWRDAVNEKLDKATAPKSTARETFVDVN